MAGRALNRLGVSDAARAIVQGEATSETVVRACLERIAAREPVVRAWSFVDPDLALAQARACDKGSRRGPLHGVPLGVKDIIDTADMPTEMGSPIYKGYRPKADAACVAIARAAGAVILGKTVTAEFAGMTPRETANPLNPAHTPGGSSSGSAAAVADYMVPAAYGTQTGGSILRPASFCGVIGFKPSFGMVNPVGVKPAAESLDTVGFIGRSLDDMELLLDVMVGRAPEPPQAIEKPRVALVRTPIWPKAEPATVEAVEDAAARLAEAGASVREVKLSANFTALSERRDVINDFERARALAWEWAHHRGEISERMTACVARGLATDPETYIDTLRLMQRCRLELTETFGAHDVLLVPCVNGEAPAGLDYGGDPAFQALWTMLHVPTLSLPTHGGPNGLPIGIQLVGPIYGDKRLLRAARWAFAAIGAWTAR